MIDEKDIVRQVLYGDKEAYARIIDRYKDQVFSLVYRSTGSRFEAEEICQEIFIRAFQQLGKYNPQKQFFTWLYTLALNCLKNHLKRQARERELKNELDAQSGQVTVPPSPEDRLINRQEEKIVQESLLKVPLNQRTALIMRFYQELSFQEIADIMQISLSSAKMRVYRGVEKLRAVMDFVND